MRFRTWLMQMSTVTVLICIRRRQNLSTPARGVLPDGRAGPECSGPAPGCPAGQWTLTLPPLSGCGPPEE